MEQVGVKFVAEGGDVYITTVNNATNVTNNFVKTTEEGSGRVSGAGQVMVGALRQIGTVAVDAMGAALKATAGFLKDSVNVAGEFESNFNRFRIAAGKGVDTKGLQQFKDLFIQLGRDLPVSTNEVEQAATEMVSGGIDPAIVAGGALKQTLQFAAASGLSLADAAQTSAKFLAGWTDSAATTEQKVAFLAESTDALTKAGAASSTTAAELRLGLFNVQGAAQALHAPFTEVVATLGLLAPAFHTSADAGTSLNVFMSRLVPQTKPAMAAMKEFGIITKTNQNLFFDQKGAFLGMANAAQVLKDHLGNLTDEQKINTLHKLFGNDAMKVGNLLMQDGSKGLNDFIAKMKEQSGVQEAAAIAQQGYGVAVKNAQGSVEALQITIGSALLPMLTDLLNNTIAPGINTVTSWADSILKADNPLQALSSSIDSILPGFNQFGSFVENLSSALLAGNWGSAFATITQGLSDLGATIGPPLIDALNSAEQMAFNWIAQEAPVWLAQLMVWGQKLADWVAPYVPVLLAALGDALNSAWAWVKEQAPGWVAQLGTWGAQLGAFVQPYVPVLLAALGDALNSAWAWVKEQAPGWGKQLLAWGNELIAWVKPMIPPALAELGRLGQAFIGWIGEQAGPLLTKLGEWANSFVAWIVPMTVTFLAEWPKMFSSFLDWIGNEAGPLLAKLGEWAVQFVAWVAPMIPGFLVAVGGIALAIGVWVIETAAVLTDKIVNKWVPAMLDWVVTDVIPKLPGILGSIQKAINDWIADAQNALAKEMIKVGSALIEGMKQGMSNAWSGMQSYVNNLAGQLPDWFRAYYNIKSPSQLMASLVGAPIVQGITQGMADSIPALLNMADAMGIALANKIGKTSTVIADKISVLVIGIQKQITTAQQAIANLAITSYDTTANMDRQKVSNLDALTTITAGRGRTQAQAQLADAEREAAAINDPKQAADYFKMRSDQILELAKLQDGINAATDATERARLHARYQLVEAAQGATRNAFTLQQQQGSSTNDLATLIRGILQSTMTAKGQSVDMPGMLDDPTIRGLYSYLDQLTAHRAPVYVGGAGGASNSYAQTTNLNMPIYTNQSPGVLQSSMAIAGAALP